MSKSSHYTNPLEYLFSLEKYGIRPGLKRIKSLLKSVGNPQNELTVIHIGGTNGKGSVSAMIASVLVNAGYKVGLYTSPHLARFNERICINGREISDKKIAELADRIRNAYQPSASASSAFGGGRHQPTFFEFTTAMAFLYFAEKKVNFAVTEVGLGGRLDATNVVKPLVSVITNIAKDHEAILGNSMEDIAFEKAGIIKKGGILVSAETKPAALNVLSDVCKKKGAVFYRLNKDFFVENFPIPPLKKGGKRGISFKGRRWLYHDLMLGLFGKHQCLNAACAIAALEVLGEKGYNISEFAVRNGLRNVCWPGRLEVLSEKPLVVLDCAHNPAGAEVLKEELRIARKSKIILVFGIMADKDINGILSILAPVAHTVIFARPQIARAASLDVLCNKVKPYAARVKLIERVEDACKTALSMAAADDMICVTGSVFTVGEARNFFMKGRR